MKISEAIRYRKSIESAAALQTDEAALENIYLYPKWEVGLSISIGDRYRYEDTLYKCVQAHTTQNEWTPDITPALWTVVSLEEWPEWVQPVGAQDSYAKDDKVSHNDKHWVSEVDSNVWEPGVYGWTEI